MTSWKKEYANSLWEYTKSPGDNLTDAAANIAGCEDNIDCPVLSGHPKRFPGRRNWARLLVIRQAAVIHPAASSAGAANIEHRQQQFWLSQHRPSHGLTGPRSFSGRRCVRLIEGDASSSQVTPSKENETGRPGNYHAKQKAFQ